MEETIMTLHPDGKNGVNISRSKYDTIREAILDAVRESGVITFQELASEVESRLKGTFDGSITWYVTTVKLDLEARQELQRVPNSRPQQLRLA